MHRPLFASFFRVQKPLRNRETQLSKNSLFFNHAAATLPQTEESIISTHHMCDSSALPWAKTALKHVCQHFLGAFLVPYVLFLLSCGIPMFLVETAMGQFTSQGCITCWRYFCPLFEGRCVARLMQNRNTEAQQPITFHVNEISHCLFRIHCLQILMAIEMCFPRLDTENVKLHNP